MNSIAHKENKNKGSQNKSKYLWIKKNNFLQHLYSGVKVLQKIKQIKGVLLWKHLWQLFILQNHDGCTQKMLSGKRKKITFIHTKWGIANILNKFSFSGGLVE